MLKNKKANAAIRTPLNTLAKANRKKPTDTEQKLWSIIRNEQTGFKFRRQHRIGRYIADFICLEKKLVLECDGGQHTEITDKERTAFLSKEGYKILRFWNHDILKNKEGIYSRILEVLAE